TVRPPGVGSPGAARPVPSAQSWSELERRAADAGSPPAGVPAWSAMGVGHEDDLLTVRGDVGDDLAGGYGREAWSGGVPRVIVGSRRFRCAGRRIRSDRREHSTGRAVT